MAQEELAGQMSNHVSCQLGELPPELFDRILREIGSLRDLANFIRTGRFVYGRFETQKAAVITGVLQNELGPVWIDAVFLSIFPYSDPTDWEQYYDGVHHMAGVYLGMLRGVSGQGVLSEGVSGLEKLTVLCRTLHNINFMADIFAAAQLRSFHEIGQGASAPSIHPDNPATAPLSRTERSRVVRAFYRRQIVSNAWAPTRRAPNWAAEDAAVMSNTSTHQGTRLGLFAAFEPWELQQIEHANLFITRLCIALVHRKGDVQGEWMEPGQFGDLYACLDNLVQYLRAHPSLAEETINDVSSQTKPAYFQMMNEQFVDAYRLLPLSSAWQSDRSQSLPDPRTEKLERDGDKLVHVEEDVDLVPFAWVDALDGRYTSWFGEGLASIPQYEYQDDWEKSCARWETADRWRCAGFAFWNRPRVEALKSIAWLETARTGWVVG